MSATHLTDRERVCQVLEELRHRSTSADVDDDIRTLERVLGDPIFRQLSQKAEVPSTSVQKFRHPKTLPASTKRTEERIEVVRTVLLPKLQPLIGENQKLLFVDLNVKDVRPVVIETNETNKRLLVIAPADIKSRSGGRIRVADRIVAIDQQILVVPQFVTVGDKSDKSDKIEGKIIDNIPESGEHQLTASSAIRASDNDSLPSAVSKSPDEKSACYSTLGTAVLSSSLIDIYEERLEQAERNHEHIVLSIIRESAPMVLTGDWTQVQMISIVNEPGVGLGFGIVGGTSTGVVVKTILPGSPADKDKRLKPGDHILRIGSISVHGMGSQQVASLLRQQDTRVDLVVGRPLPHNGIPVDTNGCWTMTTRAALCPTSLEEQVQKRIAASQQEQQQQQQQTGNSVERAQSEPADMGSETMTVEAVPEHTDDSPQLASTSQQSNANDGLSENTHENVDYQNAEASSSFEPSSTTASKVPSSRASLSLKNNVDLSKTGSAHSLRQLQEMALTAFGREKWIPGKYETVEVELTRDPVLGLGITVAGYVHKKEEISGVFVKSLVPNSSAHYSKKIQLHDLILEVNGQSLEHLSHAESVRTLVRSGTRVKLKLIRFSPGSPQAACLNMLQEQETATQVIDAQTSIRDVVAEWKKKLGADYEVVSVDLIPDKRDDGGLGISLEGTVDVLDGTQLCPHHYIDSLRPSGPAAVSNALRSGDELLQVNEVVLYGESHVTVRQALSRAASCSQRVRLTVSRKAQTVNVFVPRPEQSLPIAYPLLAAGDDRLVKAKSETCIPTSLDRTAAILQQVSQRLRSRSLQPLTGLAIWKCVPMIVCLEKDSRGLGFSVVDYQDPLHPGESVIVVRSLVPGGVAQADGRIVPGDRLMFVNDEDLSNSTLDRAVAVLKAAPQGIVRLGIAKPVPIDQCGTSGHSPIISRSERVLAKGSSPRSRRRRKQIPSSYTSSQEEVWIGAEEYRRQHPQGYYPSSGSITPSTPRTTHASLNGSHLSMISWSPCSTRSISPCGSPLHLRGSWAYDVVYLPANLERSIKIMKGPLPLGLVLDAGVDKGVNGCMVKSICSKKAIAEDGRVQVGDYVVKINTEGLRNVTNSQARAILKRANLVGTQCNVTYITASDAKLWKERFHQDTEYQSPVINRLSPKVFPKFYRSPYLDRKQRGSVDQEDSFDEGLPCSTQPSDESHPQPPSQQQPLTAIIDGSDLDQFACDLIEAVLKDAFLDLFIAGTTPDWIGRPPIPDKLESPLIERIEATVPCSSPSAQESAESSPEKFVEESQVAEGGESEADDERSGSPCRLSSQPPRQSPLIARLTQRVISSEESAKSVASTSGADSASAVDLENESGIVPYSSKESSTSAEGAVIGEDHSEALVKKADGEEKKSSDETSAQPMATATAESSSESQAQPRPNRSKFWGEARTVILHREPNQSFGISIVGGRVEVSQKGGLPGTGNTVSGIFIKSVLPNSPAGKSGMMNMGDRVISVNDYDLREATHEQAVHHIKNATNPVKFVVQSLHCFSPQHMVSFGDATRKERTESKEKNETDTDSKETSPKKSASPQPHPSDYANANVVIEKHLIRQEEVIPEQVVAEQSVEALSVEVGSAKEGTASDKESGIRLSSKDHEATPPPASEVPQTSNAYEEANKPVPQAEMVEPSKAKPSQAKVTEKRGDARDAERAKIERGSAAYLTRLPDDPEEEDRFFYTKDKIARKYGEFPGDAILLRLEKVPPGGLGLSLAGNRDRDKMSVFVVAIRSTCPLPIKVGDELLEVNGKVLLGLSHLNASAKIRECCEEGKLDLLLLRRFDALDEMAIRPEPKLSRSQTSPVCAESAAVDATYIPGKRQTSVETKEQPSKAEIALESSKEISDSGEPDVMTGPKTTQPSSENNAVQSVENVHKKSWQMERTAGIETGRETLIEIDKDGKGLGLSIVGGSDTVLGTVVIHEVYPDGAAAMDGRLKPGDQVLEVNGVSLRGVSHEHAISLLRRTPAKVRLLVYRDVNLQLSLLDPTQIYNIFDMELTKKPGRGLGLSIVGRKNEPGVYVSEVVKGGAAEADARLMQGDQILAVNGQDVTNSMQEDVAAMLKTCTGRVALRVGRWKLTETANRVHAAAEAAYASERAAGISPNGTLATATADSQLHTPSAESSSLTPEEDKKMVPPPAPSSRPTMVPQVTVEEENHSPKVVHSDLSPVTEEPSSGADQKSLAAEDESSSTVTSQSKEVELIKELYEENSDSLLIELKKVPDQQLGMGIGKRTRGILVTSLQPGSVAAEKLRVGDRLMAVNGLPITDQLSAVTLVKASGERLCLQIARPRNLPTA